MSGVVDVWDSYHVRCQPGCFRAADPRRVASRKRGRGYCVELIDLQGLVAASDGYCMICRRCHASMVDRGRTGLTVRGLVCKWCRSRLSIEDGAAGNLGQEAAAACLCNTGEPDWRARMSLATEHYLDRAARSSRNNVSQRAAFAQMVAEVRADGIDPLEAWTKRPDEIARAVASQPTRSHSPSGGRSADRVPTLQRQPCEPECLAHDEHVYVACFDVPTYVASRDHHPDDTERDYPVRHYVGWSTQQPPLKRLNQHGSACRTNLVLLVPGSERDEFKLKVLGQCPRCDHALWYFLAENRAALKRSLRHEDGPG